MRIPSAVTSVIEVLERRLVSRRSGRAPRWLIPVVVAALVFGAVLAARSLPDDLDGFRWWPIAAMVLLTIPGIALNGYEYAVSARIGGASVGFWSALRVAVYGTAANLLPIPGASLVRIEAMRRSGARLAPAAGATVAVGVCWLGVSLLLAGVLLIPRGLTAAPFVVSGAASMALVVFLLFRRADPATARSNLGRLLAVETAFVAIGATKLGLALVALGASASPVTAFTLGVSSAVAAATGFVPGGLGLREALVGALGPLVGVDPSTAFLAAVIDRFVSLSVVAVVAAVILHPRGPRPATAEV